MQPVNFIGKLSFVFIGLIAVFCVDSGSFCPAFDILYVKISLSLGTSFLLIMILHGIMVNPDCSMQVDLYTSNSKVEDFCACLMSLSSEVQVTKIFR